MTKKQTPQATTTEIFKHLQIVCDSTYCTTVNELSACYHAKNIKGATSQFIDPDAQIGGFGAYLYLQGKQPRYPIDHRPLYRPYVYTAAFLKSTSIQTFTRMIITNSVLSIESTVKHISRLSFLEKLWDGFDRLPLGSLLRKKRSTYQTKFGADAYDQLLWLNDAVYRYAKHEFSPYNGAEEDPQAALFQLDDALAIYFIARQLQQKIYPFATPSESAHASTTNLTA